MHDSTCYSSTMHGRHQASCALSSWSTSLCSGQNGNCQMQVLLFGFWLQRTTPPGKHICWNHKHEDNVKNYNESYGSTNWLVGTPVLQWRRVLESAICFDDVKTWRLHLRLWLRHKIMTQRTAAAVSGNIDASLTTWSLTMAGDMTCRRCCACRCCVTCAQVADWPLFLRRTTQQSALCQVLMCVVTYTDTSFCSKQAE